MADKVRIQWDKEEYTPSKQEKIGKKLQIVKNMLVSRVGKELDIDSMNEMCDLLKEIDSDIFRDLIDKN